MQHGARNSEIGKRGVDLVRCDFQAARAIGDSGVILLGDKLHVERESRLIVPIGDLEPARRIMLQQLVILTEHAIIEDRSPRPQVPTHYLQAEEFFVFWNQGRAQSGVEAF